MAAEQDEQTLDKRTTTWDLDPTHSSIDFSIKHMMFSSVRGGFKSFTSRLDLDEAGPAAQLEVEIDVASIDTGTGDRDAHLRSADFFDVENHPKIVFRSTGIVPDGEEKARVSGDLTIRGTTRPAVLEVVRDGVGQDPWGNTRAAYTVTTTIDREAFGLTWNQLLETGGVLVGKDVKVQAQVQVVQRKDA